MLVECGFVRAQAGDGVEWTFTPSLGRIATLGSPRQIVEFFAALHGPDAEATATYVLACLCDQEDATPLIGWHDIDGDLKWHEGAMPPAERVIVAKHLMRHGIIGKAKPSTQGDGKFSEVFEAAEYIAAARVHLGLSSADAEALSMTEFQTMLEMKFPEAAAKKRSVPSRDEYDAQMAHFEEMGRV